MVKLTVSTCWPWAVTTRLAKARIHLLRVHTNDKAKYTEIFKSKQNTNYLLICKVWLITSYYNIIQSKVLKLLQIKLYYLSDLASTDVTSPT